MPAERDPGVQAPGPGGLACGDARALWARAAADRALGLPGVTSDQIASLDAHVAGCGACRLRMDQMARAIRSDNPDEIPCAECGPALDLWITLEREGADASDSLPRVAEHLASCAMCSEELAALHTALAAWEAGTLPEPETQPRFDLSFLAGPHAEAEASQTEAPAWAQIGAPVVHPRSWTARAAASWAAIVAGLRGLGEGTRSPGSDDARSAIPSAPESRGPRSETGRPRRAFGELLLPVAALAVVIFVLADLARPEEPATTDDPAVVATMSPTPAVSPTPRIGATPTTDAGGIAPAAGPPTSSPSAIPATPTATPLPTEPDEQAEQRREDRDRDDDDPTAQPQRQAPTPTEEAGYPGPEGAPTSEGYPEPPTVESGYPGPRGTSPAPTTPLAPTARPGTPDPGAGATSTP